MAGKFEPHAGHRQRLRDRAVAEGLDAFEPHQVMELMLFYAIPRQDVSELAHRLIRRFKTVMGVLCATREELMEVEGVGKRTAEWLMSLGEAVEAYHALEDRDCPRITNRRSAFEFCGKQCGQVPAPSAWSIGMSTSGNIRKFGKMCDSLHWGDVNVFRTSVSEILAGHIRSVIIVLFTGEEAPVPTDEDVKWAEDYAYLLKGLRTLLLDVILVGSDEIVSMNQSGLYAYDDETERRYRMIFNRYLRENDGGEDETQDMPEFDTGL